VHGRVAIVVQRGLRTGWIVVKVKLRLSERVYTCECCGNEIDRDLNAAINLAYMAARHARVE
jgi:transposase